MRAVVPRLEGSREGGASDEELVVEAKRLGLTIVGSIVAMMEVRQLPLSASKAIVARQPCWKAVVDATEPLHDELQRLADEGEL